MKTVFFCLSNINKLGGIETITKTVTNELSRYYKIVIINTEPFENSDNSIFVKENISYIDVFGSKVKQIFQLYKLIKKHKSSCLIIQGKDLYYLSVLSITKKCKIIFYDHDSLLAHPVSQKNEYLPRKRASKFANKIFVLTNENKQAYIDLLNVEENRVSVIPNFIDLPVYRGEYDVNSKTIVAVGRYHQQKRFDLLIEAFHLFSQTNKDYILDIYGEGELRDYLQNLIDTKGLSKRIFLKGRYKNYDEAYMHKAFFVLTSEYEGFGIVLLEAMHYKLPVIAFNCHSGPSDIVINNVNGVLVVQQSIEELSTTMLKLTNKDIALSYSKNTFLTLDKFAKEEIIDIWKKEISE